MKGRVKANLAAGVLLLSVALAAAQGPNAHKNMRMYDPATETTLKGTVEAVTQPTRGRMMGTHLTIKVGDQTQEIMLGPGQVHCKQRELSARFRSRWHSTRLS